MNEIVRQHKIIAKEWINQLDMVFVCVFVMENNQGSFCLFKSNQK